MFGFVCLSSSSLVVDSVVLLSDVDPKKFSSCEYFLTNVAFELQFDAVPEIKKKVPVAAASTISLSGVL